MNLTGRRFSKLTVLAPVKGGRRWLCECQCGRMHTTRESFLLNRRATCCAHCQKQVVKAAQQLTPDMPLEAREKEAYRRAAHGGTLKIWQTLVIGHRRNERWNHYSNFLLDMGPCPSRNQTLIKLNLDSKYCRTNCIWYNRRILNSFPVVWNGKRMYRKIFCKAAGIHPVVENNIYLSAWRKRKRKRYLTRTYAEDYLYAQRQYDIAQTLPRRTDGSKLNTVNSRFRNIVILDD